MTFKTAAAVKPHRMPAANRVREVGGETFVLGFHALVKRPEFVELGLENGEAFEGVLEGVGCFWCVHGVLPCDSWVMLTPLVILSVIGLICFVFALLYAVRGNAQVQGVFNAAGGIFVCVALLVLRAG